MSTISYEQFAAVEVRLGRIVSVEIIPDADKLLRLMVDVGEPEPRQIVSGIRTYFSDPQTLVGMMCPFVTNLEPRVIRGYESQGMIFAASADDTLALLTPTNSVPPGTRLK
jgi:methionyl-tRNA synthetase